MRSIAIFCFIGIGCAMFSPSLKAQNTNINGAFKNMFFPEFATQIEAKTNFHFYYKKADLDSFPIDVTIAKESISQILNQVFRNTDFRFSVDTFNHIFIAKNIQLQTHLSADFFIPEKNNVAEDEEESKNKENQKQISASNFEQNKLFKIGSQSSAKRGNAVLTGFIRDNKN